MDSVVSVEKVFSERMLRIPDYQRGYAWDRQQWDELLDDIELLPVGKDHYTGTLVLHATDSSRVTDQEGRSYAVVDVVDGQQRLTTLVLLLDALRRVLSSDEQYTALAAGMRKAYVCVDELATRQPAYKLTLNEDCRKFFIESILAEKPSPEGPQILSHERLVGASAHFREYFARKRAELGSEFAQWLLQFREKVTQHLKLNVYEVTDSLDVGVVFEVMNNRGKPLAELEKVKNYLLYVASKLAVPAGVLSDEVNHAWGGIFKNLMAAGLTRSSEEDQLLRAHWLMVYDPSPRNWNGSKSIKRQFDLRQHPPARHAELLGALLRYAKTLREASLAYCDIMRPELPTAFSSFSRDRRAQAEVVAAAERVRRIGAMAPFLPLLIASRFRWPDQPSEYARLLDSCERFAFRLYRVAELRTHTGQSYLFRVGHWVFHEQITFEEVDARIRRSTLDYNPSAHFAARFQFDAERNWYWWGGLRYLLYEYETHLAGKDKVRVPWATVAKGELKDTIEHILPQTPTDPYWTERFTEEDRRKYTNDLGNLCLTFHNSSYGNKPFPDKKGGPGKDRPCYANSNLYQERALFDVADWTVAALLDRRQKLVDWALRRWEVLAPDAESVVGVGDTPPEDDSPEE